MNQFKALTYSALALATLSLSSCNDWLTEETPGTTKVSEFFTSLSTAEAVVNAAYVPMTWEFGTTYYPEWYFGDIVSDDALKGGQDINDGADLRELENFKANSDNEILLGYYRAQWQGIQRANLAIDEIPTTRIETEGDEAEKQAKYRDRYLGEAYFLRGFYYFRLARMFGGMPLIDYVIKSSNQWAQTRSTMDETLNFAIEDFKRAENLLWEKDKYSDEELGRATKGAAQAMLLKANLYRADYLRNAGNETEAQKYFAEAAKWGKEVIKSRQYSLWPNYLDNFRLANENGRESVFEIQYTEEATSDYGGEGYTRGTMTTILQRSRSSAFGEAGWGYNRPTQNLYNEYEAGDARRDETILVPTDVQIETPAQEIYCGDRMLNRKYAMYNDGTNGGIYKLAHATRSPKNNIQIRYADVLLMYAEACCESGDLPSAKTALKEVRDRAGLSQFPYTAVIQGQTVTFNDNQEDLRKAIRHERRVELAMEGHRWFDLTRWGIAKETMDTYMAGETEEAKELYGTFQKGKHELFPIPSKEIDLSGIEQNPNW
ncbi:RagB/SusD family nutrient uptake outer membrane protein [uncultured Prevotella sp.]|uniref:RagB/SusD family nutrient uptake outer membrane protein n=1 Tax=uncultured Prevotella sp. TaxID=159272 RepID=UPI0026267077|nr:RagB/SusD family nutrient uptake outer membrane protein [uncultured Prevotella sp.]